MELEAYTVAQFCTVHGISRATFYNLVSRREAPRLMKVGTRTLISREAAADWRRERETAVSADSATRSAPVIQA